MSQQGAGSIQGLFGSLVEGGTVTAAAAAGLFTPDLAAQLGQGGLGVDPNQVQASEVFIMVEVVDDSGSIRFVSGNSQAVRDGHNIILDALNGSKQKSGVVMRSTYLNGTVLCNFAMIEDVPRMTPQNYDPNGGTPLYDAIAEAVAATAAKIQEFEDAGVSARAVIVVITDGHDEGSRRFNARKLQPVVRDLLKSEKVIVCGMGIADGFTDFRAIFREVGLEDRWILTPQNSPSEIRRAFGAVSQTAQRASQTGANFSQQATGGGFGAP